MFGCCPPPPLLLHPYETNLCPIKIVFGEVCPARVSRYTTCINFPPHDATTMQCDGHTVSVVHVTSKKNFTIKCTNHSSLSQHYNWFHSLFMFRWVRGCLFWIGWLNSVGCWIKQPHEPDYSNMLTFLTYPSLSLRSGVPSSMKSFRLVTCMSAPH